MGGRSIDLEISSRSRMVVRFLSSAMLASDSEGNGLGGGGGALLTLICTSNLGSIGRGRGCIREALVIAEVSISFMVSE